MLENAREICVFDTKVKAFGRSIRVVLTYNAATARKKDRYFQKDLGKALAELNHVRWAKVKDPEAMIQQLVDPKLPAYPFKTQGAGASLKVGLDQKGVRTYTKRFGRTLVFTDRDDLTAAQAVPAYTDRNEVEQLFGEMNDPMTVPFRSVRPWTDQRIVVHAFICILGLILLKLLQLRLKEQGISPSLHIIKDELSSVNLGFWMTRLGKLFKIISDRLVLQAKMFCILLLQNVACMLGVHQDSSQQINIGQDPPLFNAEAETPVRDHGQANNNAECCDQTFRQTTHVPEVRGLEASRNSLDLKPKI